MLGHTDPAGLGLCPCGAEAAPGSTYCSYDCIPNHRGGLGAASWRAEHAALTDDSQHRLIDSFTLGTNQAHIYEIVGTDSVHCRLDDGHRFVGLDADAYQVIAGLEPVWQRLDNELTNLPIPARARTERP